ncbi:hypothetical protein N7466_004914 [Penicillium verhagenii]|uniref:uncharacterized protein n=1 Tax=Penicillium verhagenii TaxID=1562060 RepID=UPI00254588E0|nr:uncharacterized protein N7466_004914 [Penicillium verhagenii]KAJ5935367.1 hypothetical protein N7466_004914 [Penicillium verhagenii]
MNISLRSSQSSYGDPRYLSTATVSDVHAPSPLGKTLVDGYRDAVNQSEDRARYNPLNPAHPRSSALVNTSDPVTMYLLTETAMGDSTNYEILSFEEVEDLKKERSLLSTRIEGTKRKLTLETKLRDAAQSIGRLYSPPSPRSSGEYGANGKSHRRSRSIFGRSGTAQVLDKSDSELAMSQRKCEELAQELWKLENRSQQISQRLLEHTAGVLQMTHKGLRKTPKNSDELASDLDDGHDFDDRHLYRTPEHIDNHGLNGRIDINPTVDNEAMEATEKRLDELSQRICEMMIQSTPDEFVDPPPQPKSSADPTQTIEAHLAYIESGMNSLASRGPCPNLVGPGTAPEAEGAWRQHLTVINTRVQSIVDRFGLTRSPTLPPPPSATDGEGLEEQLGYLQTGIDGLESRVDGLIEQKSILTIQIQQQRELNSKSDAERDAHIGDLTEQLAYMRKDYETSQRDGKTAQDELAVLMEQLEAMRNNGSTQEEAKAALVQAEGEVARLNSVVDSLQHEVDIRAQEAMEARARADSGTAQLEASAKQYREEADVRVQEAVAEAVQEAIDRRLQVENQLATAEVQRAEMETQLVQAEERRTQVEAQIAQVEERRIEVEARFAEVDAQISEVEGRRAEVEERCIEVESQIAQVDERRVEAEERCAEFESQIAQAEEHRIEAEERCIKIETKIAQVEERRVEAEERCAEIESQMEEIEERRIEAEERCVELEGLLLQAEKRHAEASREMVQADGQEDLAEKFAESEEKRAEAENLLAQVVMQRDQAEADAERAHNEMTDLEGEVVRITTELTMVKADLDGAYGTRAQRAAEVALNPEIQNEIDALNTRNLELTVELAELRGKQGGGDAQKRADTLEKELRETLDDYEAMTKASIEFEKERERFESVIDSLRDRSEQLETQLSEERISWMNLSSPTTMGRDPTMETTSTMVLKNEFKKMMRDTRSENMRILKAEQEERRRIEGLLRALRKEHAQLTGKPLPSPVGTPL